MTQLLEKPRKARGDTQSRILAFIMQEIALTGYPAFVREIGVAVEPKSLSTVHGHLCRLESKGLLVRGAMKPRAMGPTKRNEESNLVRLIPLPGPGTWSS